jgi:hypothetical protein
MERRTFNTAQREKWNKVIHYCIKAIDNHNMIYFQTKNPWHLEKAKQLRQYIVDLKEMIKREERE